MSILIKGMEMPTSGTYEVSIDNTNGKDKTIMSMFVRGSGGLICCGVYEIVPVPPHGRCIDADALKVSIAFAEKTAEWAVPALRAVLMVIDEMPTIIPAEEGE